MGFLVKLFGGVEKSEVEQMKASHQAELDKMKKSCMQNRLTRSRQRSAPKLPA